MKKFVDLVKLDRMDNLIRRKETGNTAELAQKLEMSKSSLYELLTFLKDDMRAPISYNSIRQSYVYEYTPKFHLGFESDRLKTDIMAYNSGASETCVETESKPAHQENRRVKRTTEIELEYFDYILENDIDFNYLYYY